MVYLVELTYNVRGEAFDGEGSWNFDMTLLEIL